MIFRWHKLIMYTVTQTTGAVIVFMAYSIHFSLDEKCDTWNINETQPVYTPNQKYIYSCLNETVGT